jgi:hypothetical protein
MKLLARAINQPGVSAISDRLTKTQLTQLRELRAEVQDLQEAIGHIRSGQVTIPLYAGYIKHTVEEVTALIDDLRTMEDSSAHGDTIRHLRNILEQMNCCLNLTDPQNQLSAEEKLHFLNILDLQCAKLIFQIGRLTIPERINILLDNARPGYYIPFHSVFERELPNREERAEILNHLIWQPKLIEGGLIDSSTGLIYKYATSHIWKAITFLMLVASIVWTIVALVRGPYALAQLGFPIEPVPAPFTTAYMTLWIAVLAGVGFHMVVATAKRHQADPNHPPIIALGTFFPLVNAKIGRAGYKLLLTLIGFVGLIAVAGLDKATMANAFLLGYSLDSIVELFGATIERQAAAQTAVFRKQLGLAAEQ